MVTPSRIISNVICPFCGCLCDDIQLTVEDGHITKNVNGCALSKAKFLSYTEDRMLYPTIRESSKLQRVTLNRAITQAAQILIDSKRPLIYGLSSTENDAHREIYHIAELIGGVVDNTSSVCHGPSILGVQESGEPLGSLAEVRNRADLVIYWGANPLFAHPRHIERFVRSPGVYVQNPRRDRQLWVIDIRNSATSRIADRTIVIAPGSDLEVISVLRAIIRGHDVDVSQVGGLPVETLYEMAETMRQAKYGVLFYGLGLTQSRGRHRNIDAAIRLVQDLNNFTKWSMMPMRGHYNVAGANKTSTWTTGYPFAIDYSRGYPRYQPGEYTAVDLLRRKEVDVLLNIAADPVAHFPRQVVHYMRDISIINIDPKNNLTSMFATVNIPTAMAGIECDGVAVRMDGLPLYLQKIVEPPEGVLPDRDVLRMMYDEIKGGIV